MRVRVTKMVSAARHRALKAEVKKLPAQRRLSPGPLRQGSTPFDAPLLEHFVPTVESRSPVKLTFISA